LERRIDRSSLRLGDSGLEAYLTGLVLKLVAPGSAAASPSLRVKVIRNPLLNAFALPNGALYVHTGLLARVDNEAQLVTVLGHELTHFIERHTLREMRSAKNKIAWLSGLQITLALAGTAVGGPGLGSALGQLSGDIGGLWALAAVRGYSRELETDADEEGLALLVQTGYDPGQAPEVFRHFQRDLDSHRVEEPFFFGTHPRLQDRIDNYVELLRTRYAAAAAESGRARDSDAFFPAVAEVLLINALLDLDLGRFNTARAAVEKHLRGRPESARGYFVLGELERRADKGQPHLGRAITAYKRAARLDPTYAEPRRELGLLYRAEGRSAQARAELQRYLELSPDAVDAPIIRDYLQAGAGR
jgi:predicted Zn-dependent protease